MRVLFVEPAGRLANAGRWLKGSSQIALGVREEVNEVLYAAVAPCAVVVPDRSGRR